MKIRKGFVLEEVGDSFLACATGKLAREFSGFIRMNETGAFLWKKLSEKSMTEAELVSALLAEYDTTEEVAKADVSSFVDNLNKSNIIED